MNDQKHPPLPDGDYPLLGTLKLVTKSCVPSSGQFFESGQSNEHKIDPWNQLFSLALC